jgi:hypothetical protein
MISAPTSALSQVQTQTQHHHQQQQQQQQQQQLRTLSCLEVSSP